MDLLENPFYILGATLRDNKRKIIELAEEKSLYNDSTQIERAQADLINPRKRVAAELAWLPGVGPRLTHELICNLEEGGKVRKNQLNNLNSLAIVNILVSQLRDRQFSDKVDWDIFVFEILDIAKAFENIMIEELVEVLNADRVAAGFPEISDELFIEEELHERKRCIRQIIKESLNHVPSNNIIAIMKKLVMQSTGTGNKHGFVIIDDLVDGYKIAAQDFLETEGNNVEILIASIRESLEKGFSTAAVNKLISQLIAVMKNWQLVAEPIQINAKARGEEHQQSKEIALSVRSLAIDIYNDNGQMEASAQLIESVKRTFIYLPDIVERISEDCLAIKSIAENAKKREIERDREITYETSVGKLFADKLKISPMGIEWKGTVWPLEEITRVRWGGIKRSVNGIPTGTTYSIYFGTKTNSVNIVLNKSQYNAVVDCLWKAVGVNIFKNFLKGLQSRSKYDFGPAEINDEGVYIEKFNFFSANERKHFCWNELTIWNEPGCFCIGSKDEKFKASFSYLDHDNTHVLETAVRALWKNYNPKLSSLLGG